ncbi:lipase maturation factor 1-like [Saccoglossus kowalevskii]|uniref:Lipase maturation factor n=1 Tax=Saccoglossus kowalevskii TaxID=10224 RepID=A0ABM0GUW5_SACKO|nr:PREDICTED: lipase maturation factor 1-like [Saccoglossus kowalevskii]
MADKSDDSSQLRRRRTRTNEEGDDSDENNPMGKAKVADSHDEKEIKTKNNGLMELEPGTYWLTRIVFLRSLAFIYSVAFLVALHQNRALLGKNGLLPVNVFMLQIKEHFQHDIHQCLNAVPTILWFCDINDVDFYLDAIATIGLVLAILVTVCGCSNMVVMTLLWILYHSIVNVGQRWYSFGWESQLLETGFLAIFMCPLLTWRQIPRKTPTPLVTILGYRWLIFRIMLGAGLIKIRGDQCWRDLTCMNYHYETQPVPNPISYYMHQEPEFFHKFETLVNHFIELVAPFLIWIPWRPAIILGGLFQVLFQVVLIISGNLSFLNWLTILPSLCCMDDKFYAFLFSNSEGWAKHKVCMIQREARTGTGPRTTWGMYVRRVVSISLGILIAYLSIPVVQNLLSKYQAMNTSFDSLRLVNTYGAFGSVTKERTEVIIQGTLSERPRSPEAVWLEYEFKCKPGNVTRRPCLISPYHYRLDWLIWFAAFQNYESNPWLLHLAAKFMVNDESTLDLIAYNPFQDTDPPRYIRMEHYRYTYTKIGSESAKRGQWWDRTKIADYLPPVSLNDIVPYLKRRGYGVPKLRGKVKLKDKKIEKKT